MDFSNLYNTKLTPAQEVLFQNWLKEQSGKQDRDISNDLQDYDLRGAYAQDLQRSDNGHLPDTFKKPNHPTFSDQSQYNGVDNMTGGSWGQTDQGKDTFTPSPSNLKMGDTGQLMDYFKNREPDSDLILQTNKDQTKFDKLRNILR